MEQQVQIKREIHPTYFALNIDRQPDGTTRLVAILPLDGEAYVFSLDDATQERLRDALLGGIKIAGPNQMPSGTGSPPPR